MNTKFAQQAINVREEPIQFPNTLYVYDEAMGTDDIYLAAYETYEKAVSVGQKKLLGVYRLERTIFVMGEARILEVVAGEART